MITIFSKRDYEVSTEKVMDWLWYFGIDVKRINGHDLIESLVFENGEFDFEDVSDRSTVCWFRRFMDEDFLTSKLKNDLVDATNENLIELHLFLSKEVNIITRYWWSRLKDKKWLSHPLTELRITKLDMLEAAKACELDTPDTLITSSKAKVKTFKKKHGRIISKPMSDPAVFKTETTFFTMKTIEVTDENIATFPDRFYPSLFQELIEKEFELRIFYLDSTFYPMAIFSQLDEQTRVDFRNYNHDKPNRRVPYRLPDDLEAKLHAFIKYTNMTTGSIDIIKAIDGRYIFLEINPVGQFGMTSTPCNYHLEKRIAQYLINQHENTF